MATFAVPRYHAAICVCNWYIVIYIYFFEIWDRFFKEIKAYDNEYSNLAKMKRIATILDHGLPNQVA